MEYTSHALLSLPGLLLPWFEINARELPWRKESTGSEQDGYRVWISEIMLQQTRVEAVKQYYIRFMQAFPNVEALAGAKDEVLMKLWEGLGYYSRARNLKKAAVLLQEENRSFPESYEELLRLPGIGFYTAGAIASIAYNQCVSAVDGNVLRVIMRYLGCFDDITQEKTKKQVKLSLDQVIPQKQPGQFNQALMELGALVCVPNGAPLCGICPLCEKCFAKKKSLIQEIPVKKAGKKRRIEEKVVLLFFDHGRVAIRKRPQQGLLAGLWEFPMEDSMELTELVSYLEKDELGFGQIGLPGKAKHIFSHIEWQMTGYAVELERKNPAWAKQFVWADEQQLREEYAVPNAFAYYKKYVLEKLQKNSSQFRQTNDEIFG